VGSRFDYVRADRVRRFFALHLRQTKGRWAGQPLVLEDWQFWHIIAPVFGLLEEEGTELRWYRDAVIGLSRKNAKSTLCSGIAAYLLTADGEGAPEVYSLAGDRAQAGLVFREASLMMQASPLLRRMGKFYRGVIEVPENMGLYKVMSSRADLSHGTNPSGSIIDEYHVHKSDALREAIQTGTGAREQPLVVTISTAPAARKGPMWDLMQPYLDPRPDDKPADPRQYFYWVGLEAGADPSDHRNWKRANPASWITEAYLADQFAKLPLRSFEQLHLNRVPAVKGGGWLPSRGDPWGKCAGMVVIDPELPCVIGVDAAPKRDSTAVVLAQLHADQTVHVRCWVFRADPNLGYLDFDLVEGLIRDLSRAWWVTRIVVDPFAMMRSMMMLAAEGLPVEDYPQNHSRMTPASMGLHQLVIEGRLRHGGDEELAAAAANATTQATSFGWRLVKAHEEGRIDALIALAMAVRILQAEDLVGASPNVMVV
jgi:phage terminase large subunit-like protein